MFSKCCRSDKRFFDMRCLGFLAIIGIYSLLYKTLWGKGYCSPCIRQPAEASPSCDCKKQQSPFVTKRRKSPGVASLHRETHSLCPWTLAELDQDHLVSNSPQRTRVIAHSSLGSVQIPQTHTATSSCAYRQHRPFGAG